MPADRPVLQIDVQPSLGPHLFSTGRGESPLPTELPEMADLPPPAIVGAVSSIATLSTQLDVLIAEVQGLRQDLADRTLAGRCRRAWQAIRRWLGDRR